MWTMVNSNICPGDKTEKIFFEDGYLEMLYLSCMQKMDVVFLSLDTFPKGKWSCRLNLKFLSCQYVFRIYPKHVDALGWDFLLYALTLVLSPEWLVKDSSLKKKRKRGENNWECLLNCVFQTASFTYIQLSRKTQTDTLNNCCEWIW